MQILMTLGQIAAVEHEIWRIVIGARFAVRRMRVRLVVIRCDDVDLAARRSRLFRFGGCLLLFVSAFRNETVYYKFTNGCQNKEQIREHPNIDRL